MNQRIRITLKYLQQYEEAYRLVSEEIYFLSYVMRVEREVEGLTRVWFDDQQIDNLALIRIAALSARMLNSLGKSGEWFDTLKDEMMDVEVGNDFEISLGSLRAGLFQLKTEYAIHDSASFSLVTMIGIASLRLSEGFVEESEVS